jgi:uncharacterized phiE125 gp8 family phage protein
MILSLVQVTPPAIEPISLATAKTHLRVSPSDTSQDAYITALITAARQRAEKECNRAFITQTWKLNLDFFPWYGDAYKRPNIGSTSIYAITMGLWSESMTVRLPVPHALSIISIEYIDPNTTELITLDPSTYLVDLDTEPARLCPTPGNYWPYPQLYRPNSVQITYTCGYGPEASDVPLAICQAMLMLISHWFWNRDAVVQGQYAPLPLAVDCLLGDYKFVNFLYQ